MNEKKSHVINQPKVIGMCNDYIDTCFCKSLDLYSIVRDLRSYIFVLSVDVLDLCSLYYLCFFQSRKYIFCNRIVMLESIDHVK